MASLPRGDRAILDIRKLEDYCLNPSHPRGRHKARVFGRALGIQRKDAAWLQQVLLDAARHDDTTELAVDAHGSRWRMDSSLSRHGKQAVVRSIWMVRIGSDVPRFVTCWIL